MPSSEIWGLYGNFIPSIVRNLHTALHSGYQYNLFLIFVYYFVILFVSLFCLHWVFVAAHGLSPTAVSGATL